MLNVPNVCILHPCGSTAMYWKRNHQTDEEMEEMLKERYSTKIQGNREKKQDMVKFFAAMKDPSANPEQEQKMREVLHGGRGDKKRHFAVDESLYGTEEGMEKRLRLQAEAKSAEEDAQKRKGKKKRKKKRKRQTVDEEAVPEELPIERGSTAPMSFETKGIAAVGGMAVLALAAILAGGKRS